MILDGFILIFLGYNSGILTKINKWDDSKIYYLDINFHIFSGIGGLISLLFNANTNKESLNVASFLTLVAFCSSIALINISEFFIYLSVFALICISNGHLQNFSLNSIIKKFDENQRAVIMAYTYFFNQLGKFLFACLINKFHSQIKKGDIEISIFPIFLILIVQLILIFVILNYMGYRTKAKFLLEKENPDYRNEILRKKKEKEIENVNSLNAFNSLFYSYSNNSNDEHNFNSIKEKEIISFNNNNKKDKENNNLTYNNILDSFYEKFKSFFFQIFIGKDLNQYNNNNINNNPKEKDYKNTNNANSNKALNDNKSNDIRERKNSKGKETKISEQNLVVLSIREIKDPNNDNEIYSKYLYNSLSEIFPRRILYHQFTLIFLNFSLGVLFYSLINIFPHFHYHFTYSNISEEIFYSKKIHTVLLFFFPLIFLIKNLNRKYLLFTSFFCSLIINLMVLFNLINSTAFVHIFRFIWNTCYISTNLYSVEASPKKIRFLNSSIMSIFFKVSSIIEILMIEKLITINLYLPVFINIIILIFDILLIYKLKYETHRKSLEEIEGEFFN